MQHCHFKTLSLRQLTLYYIEMRKEVTTQHPYRKLLVNKA